jgi:hypothetical protein
LTQITPALAAGLAAFEPRGEVSPYGGQIALKNKKTIKYQRPSS